MPLSQFSFSNCLASALMQVPGLKEAEPELYKSLEAALATIAANGAAATAAAESAAAAKAAADAAPTAPRSREGNAAGFPTSMPSSGPSNPNMLFSTINAETLEMSAQNVTFPVPEDKVSGGSASRPRPAL